MNATEFVSSVRDMLMDDTPDWHLNKAVTISILSIMLGLCGASIAMAVSGIWAFADMRRDISVIQSELKFDESRQREIDERHDKVDADTISVLRSELALINTKLDRLRDLNEIQLERLPSKRN
jgi:hypothetical protein